MQVIIIYSDGLDAKIFDNMQDALDHVIEEDLDPECIIEYDGCGNAVVCDGYHLSCELSGRIMDVAVSKAEQARLESENPR
tara:strand:+ start:43 stop:285 length:243 start_codon:yes stop_codon:yes gene_type:complete